MISDVLVGRTTLTMNGGTQVIKAVLMEVCGAGAEAEVPTALAASHGIVPRIAPETTVTVQTPAIVQLQEITTVAEADLHLMMTTDIAQAVTSLGVIAVLAATGTDHPAPADVSDLAREKHRAELRHLSQLMMSVIGAQSSYSNSPPASEQKS